MSQGRSAPRVPGLSIPICGVRGARTLQATFIFRELEHASAGGVLIVVEGETD